MSVAPVALIKDSLRAVAGPLLLPQRRPHSLTHYVKGATLIPEHISPSTRARDPAAGVSAESDRAGSRDRDDTGFARGRTCKRDHSIVGDHVFFGADDLSDQRVLIRRAAAQSQAGRYEICFRFYEFGSLDGCTNRSANGLAEALLALCRAHMVAGTGVAHTQDPSRLIADYCRGARLPAIDPQKPLVRAHFPVTIAN
jgi:hypothetical protein